MDRGAWWATVHGVTRVRHDLVTKLPPPLPEFNNSYIKRPPFSYSEDLSRDWNPPVEPLSGWWP